MYCQVIDDIQNKYNLTEIGRIIITNINLLDESVVSLVDVSALSDFIDYICDNNKNDGDASEIYLKSNLRNIWWIWKSKLKRDSLR